MQLQKNTPQPQQQLLAVAETYLRQSVAPQAAKIDRQPEVLAEALQGLGSRSLLALRVPQTWQGGGNFSKSNFYRFQMLVARYSGALAFLQTQHQSAAFFLVASSNESLQQEYLPRMGTGEVLLGVGFSQLRRRGEAAVKAVEVEGGYVINGEVPWITGFGLFNDFVVGAMLGDRREVYGVVPFENVVSHDRGKISFSQPMQLNAMVATNTVSATLANWFLPRDRVIVVKPANSIHANGSKNVLNHSFFPLGCAQAGLDVLNRTFQQKKLDFLQQTSQALELEFSEYRRRIFAALESESLCFQEKLQLRAAVINLALRCSHAAVVASSGGANLQASTAGRIYREALLFSVSGQTTAVMEATLAQLHK
ncbi:MAG: acyl-CoA dehydrogenase family protein [Oscillatoria sp. PMC 1068.18]|nr:acyl-CoA dehydrogenase family protein [Oscillatoria sp. PMC 1076.18]MEC4989830.1 acyl-CoA dehydrogenase family protein [Oscillatoria sp. PMC 1068.18]